MATHIEQVKDFVEAVGEENIVILVAEGSWFHKSWNLIHDFTLQLMDCLAMLEKPLDLHT
jgi:hypothetical protein